jgi:Raf kinase inhibitor-like YbhB/YbcL family protein
VSVFSLLALAGTATAQTPPGGPPPGPGRGGPRPPPLILSSPAMEDGGILPDKYSVSNTAGIVTPPLSWINTPANAQSFVLIVHDLDVTMQRGMGDNLHWLLFNIPAGATSLPENLPQTSATTSDGATQLKIRNGFFFPPSPPAGFIHHYEFDLYALDIKLPLDASATRDDVEKAMAGHVVGKGVIMEKFKH